MENNNLETNTEATNESVQNTEIKTNNVANNNTAQVDAVGNKSNEKQNKKLTLLIGQDTMDMFKHFELFASKNASDKEGIVNITHVFQEDRAMLSIDAVANRRQFKFVTFSEPGEFSGFEDGQVIERQFSLKNFNAAIKASVLLKQDVMYAINNNDIKFWVNGSGGLKVPYTNMPFKNLMISGADDSFVSFTINGEVFNTMLTDGGSYRSKDKESIYGKNVYFCFNHEDTSLEVMSCDDTPAIIGRYITFGKVVGVENNDNNSNYTFEVSGNTDGDKLFTISHDDIYVIKTIFGKAESIKITITENLMLIGNAQIGIILSVPLQKDSLSFLNKGLKKIESQSTIVEFEVDGTELLQAMNYLNIAAEIDVDKASNKSLNMKIQKGKLQLNMYNNQSLSNISVYTCNIKNNKGTGETKVNPKFLSNIVNILGKGSFIFEVREGLKAKECGAIFIRKVEEVSKTNFTVLTPVVK